VDYGLASGEVESSLAGSGTGAAAQTVDNKKKQVSTDYSAVE
jgi:hypothetical protein